MKKYSLLFVMALSVIVSCTREYDTTNSYSATTPPAQVGFAVNGINDLVFANWFSPYAKLYITVQYFDSTQEMVTLSMSALPPGIVMDTTWQNAGTPTYHTILSLYDTTLQGAAPGRYPVTLTATTPSGKQKSYSFNITVRPMSTAFLGKYSACYLYCDSTLLYTDSVYRDPLQLNKIWLANYANSGHAIYGIVTLPGSLDIPAQTLGSNVYSGQGGIGPFHAINISISGSCVLNMR